MAKAAKAVNYTDAQVKVMSDYYTGKDNAVEIKNLAAQMGRSEASVRAKLSNLGVYVKNEAVKSSSTAKVTKQVKSAQIAKLANMNAVESEALVKTTVAVLDKLIVALTAKTVEADDVEADDVEADDVEADDVVETS